MKQNHRSELCLNIDLKLLIYIFFFWHNCSCQQKYTLAHGSRVGRGKAVAIGGCSQPCRALQQPFLRLPRLWEGGWCWGARGRELQSWEACGCVSRLRVLHFRAECFKRDLSQQNSETIVLPWGVTPC